MCAGTVHVELGRVRRICARKHDVFVVLIVGPAHIECLLEPQFIGFSVDGHRTFTADIDDAELAIVE